MWSDKTQEQRRASFIERRRSEDVAEEYDTSVIKAAVKRHSELRKVGASKSEMSAAESYVHHLRSDLKMHEELTRILDKKREEAYQEFLEQKVDVKTQIANEKKHTQRRDNAMYEAMNRTVSPLAEGWLKKHRGVRQHHGSYIFYLRALLASIEGKIAIPEEVSKWLAKCLRRYVDEADCYMAGHELPPPCLAECFGMPRNNNPKKAPAVLVNYMKKERDIRYEQELTLLIDAFCIPRKIAICLVSKRFSTNAGQFKGWRWGELKPSSIDKLQTEDRKTPLNGAEKNADPELKQSRLQQYLDMPIDLDESEKNAINSAMKKLESEVSCSAKSRNVSAHENSE